MTLRPAGPEGGLDGAWRSFSTPRSSACRACLVELELFSCHDELVSELSLC